MTLSNISNIEDIKICEMVKTAYDAFDEKKGIDIKILKVASVTSIADYFVIVTGANPSQITALQDNAYKKLSDKGYRPTRIEGIRHSSWVLMDYSDIILHIFTTEDREFYNLDHIWKDADTVSRRDLGM